MNKNEFYAKWLEHFSAGISKRELEKHVLATGNYLWHVFSWELLEDNRFLMGDQAREAYDEIDKRGAIYIEWFEDEKTHDITRNLNTALDLDKKVEVYVVASDFSWTYIKTHESMCGPYFMKL